MVWPSSSPPRHSEGDPATDSTGGAQCKEVGKMQDQRDWGASQLAPIAGQGALPLPTSLLQCSRAVSPPAPAPLPLVRAIHRHSSNVLAGSVDVGA
eukprot:562517-Alexandrium_andersonii.AAC.1